MKKQSFSTRVYGLVKQIPSGKVATYGQIAAKLGSPKAARAVGNALHRNPDPKSILCHRVVRHDGRLAKNFAGGGLKEQKRKLLAEGVKFGNKNDVEKHLYFFPPPRRRAFAHRQRCF